MLESLQRKLRSSSHKRLITLGLVSLFVVFLGTISRHPYLWENPIWIFSKPSNETIIATLPSAKGVNYRPLKSLLEHKKWEASDKETQKIIGILLRDPVYQSQNPLLYPSDNRSTDIQKLPCTDLLTIDRLWLNYSQNRYGFSIQTQIVEADNRLERPEQVKRTCVNQCPKEIRKTIATARCELDCESRRIEAESQRIPEKMGRGKPPADAELSAGYYPSPIYGFLVQKSDAYRELAKRANQCKL